MDDKKKKDLDPNLYHIAFEKGTEAPFSGKFYKHFETGMYVCAVCGQELFSSTTKFDSDCGWPSFDKSLTGNVKFAEDNSLGMKRTEVMCSNCGAHLGHVFDDAPKDPSTGSGQATGNRFCINSISLDFKPKK